MDPDGEFGIYTGVLGAVAGSIGGAITGYYQNGWDGAMEGAAIGAAAGGAVGVFLPNIVGAFATNTLASIAGQMMSNKYHGAGAFDNLDIIAAISSGLGGVASISAKGISAFAPRSRPDVIGNFYKNTQPNKVIGTSIMAVSEGVGTAIGETVGKEWNGLAQKMVTEIRAPQVQQSVSE
ncbi:hypothetical protein [Shewanella surugensis]|uniref:Uncharacterized protein n=1 Tax=Shewanella surugensis TaxID=212020 RepID=A0ABT0LFZ7_9GAMM|nr:hypothetical protein [Shewanella surugensis]MCL1126081.1 hypothetical protein [Shewanella surugensis]